MKRLTWTLLIAACGFAVACSSDDSDDSNSSSGGASSSSSSSSGETTSSGGASSSSSSSSGETTSSGGSSSGESSSSGSSSGASSSSGGTELPPGNTPLTELTETERGVLCDDLAARAGGYGYEEQCGEPPNTSTIGFAASREECLGRVPADCALTIDQARGCADAMGEDMCVALFSAACAPLLACAR